MVGLERIFAFTALINAAIVEVVDANRELDPELLGLLIEVELGKRPGSARVWTGWVGQG